MIRLFKPGRGSVLLCAVACASLSANAGLFDAWQCDQKITLSGYTKSETLYDFPLLVKFTAGSNGFQYSQFASPTGGDLRFSDWNQDHAVYHEIEKWDTNGTSYVWVRVPSLSQGTIIWAFWGNAGATTPPVYTTNGQVWANSYAGVWHLSEGGFGTRYDSSPYRNNGAPMNYEGAEPDAGMIGGADHFNNNDANDYILVPDNQSLHIGSEITVSTWVKADTWVGEGSFVYKGNTYRFYNRDTGTLNLTLRLPNGTSPDQVTYPISNLAAGQWYHLAGTYDNDGGANNFVLYVNGATVSVLSATGNINSNDTGAIFIGMKDATTSPFKGVIDEVRIASAKRSANWIWASFMSHGSNSVFSAYRSVQIGNRTNAPSIVSLPVSGLTGSSATMNGNLTSYGNAATRVWIYWGTNDPGHVVGAWKYTNFLGIKSVTGIVSLAASGLATETKYYYLFYASNAVAGVWSDPTISFTTQKDMSQYADRMKITFKGYTKSEPLTNFPALVVFGTNVSSAVYKKFASTNGGDLRFLDANQGETLYHEIDSWNPAGISYVWVKIPLLSSTSDCIWAFWGNGGATSAPSYTTNGATWDTHYKGVWHITETAGTRFDSTANANNGNPYGTIFATTGVVGSANRFYGQDGDDWIEMPNSTTLENVQENNYTLEAWYNPQSVPPGINNNTLSWGVLMKQGFHLGLTYYLARTFIMDHWLVGDARVNVGSTATYATGSWHYVVGVIDRTNGIARMYGNGYQSGLTTFGAGTGSREYMTDLWRIGIGAPGATDWRYAADAIADEVRISGVARSSNWIWASWLNQASNSVFCSYDRAPAGMGTMLILR